MASSSRVNDWVFSLKRMQIPIRIQQTMCTVAVTGAEVVNTPRPRENGHHIMCEITSSVPLNGMINVLIMVWLLTTNHK